LLGSKTEIHQQKSVAETTADNSGEPPVKRKPDDDSVLPGIIAGPVKV